MEENTLGIYKEINDLCKSKLVGVSIIFSKKELNFSFHYEKIVKIVIDYNNKEFIFCFDFIL
jgi:hypothetical protein